MKHQWYDIIIYIICVQTPSIIKQYIQKEKDKQQNST